MCGGSILSCCPRNPYGHERALKEEEDNFLSKQVRQSSFSKNVIQTRAQGPKAIKA